MSGQRELRERRELLEELRQIVQAMKNLAFAEIQRLSHMQPVQAQARDAVMRALRAFSGDAAPAGGPAADTDAPVCWLLIGAERGFCGAFNDRLAAEAIAVLREEPRARLLVASQRLYEALRPESGNVLSLAGCTTLEDADAVLDEWVAALAREAPHCRAVWLLHAGEAGMVRVRLLPDPVPPVGTTGTTSPTDAANPPLRYLPIQVLYPALVRQALRLLLQGGLCDSLQQENRWRLSQMQRAQDHLDELGQVLRRRNAALRQADITNEQETLMSSMQTSMR